MKTNQLFIGLIFLAISCQKEDEMVATTVQIKSTEYFSGDSIGNVSFRIKELYTASYYGITDSTSDYGSFFGSFEHPSTKTFEVEVTTNYLNPFPKIALTEGEHNVVEIQLIDVANFQLALDCSGTGYVQNVKCVPTVTYDSSSPLYGYEEGLTKNFSSICGNTQPIVHLFSGQWIVSYDWKPTSSSSWTTLTDTINLVPGQDYIHTIVY